MSDRIEWLCNIYGAKCGSGFAGNVYGIDGISPTITCVGGGGNRMPMILVRDEREKHGRQEYAEPTKK